MSEAPVFLSEEVLRRIHEVVVREALVQPKELGGHWIWRTGKTPRDLFGINNLKRAIFTIWRGTPKGEVWRGCGFKGCINPWHNDDREDDRETYQGKHGIL